jgi:hypothetical protein
MGLFVERLFLGCIHSSLLPYMQLVPKYLFPFFRRHYGIWKGWRQMPTIKMHSDMVLLLADPL